MSPVARCKRNARLEQVTRAVELVAHLEVGPPPGRIDDLAPGVQVSVRLLCGGDELGRLAAHARSSSLDGSRPISHASASSHL